MTWTRDPLVARRAERERLIGIARAHAEQLATRLPLTAAAVAGSVARGDFNVWSDVDLVVVSDALPARWLERGALLDEGRPGAVEVHGYTTEEFLRAVDGGDALAREARAAGVGVHGAWPGA